jgi:hypothetical protein
MLGTGLGLVLLVTLVCFVAVQFFKTPVNSVHSAQVIKSASAKLPCMADNHCPVGQSCVQGNCIESFLVGGTADPSSCSAKECQGINQPCSRKEAPCSEGTFCQKEACVKIAAPDEGEAYKQIGMLDTN